MTKTHREIRKEIIQHAVFDFEEALDIEKGRYRRACFDVDTYNMRRLNGVGDRDRNMRLAEGAMMDVKTSETVIKTIRERLIECKIWLIELEEE